MPTAMGTYPRKSVMNGQSENIAACPAALPAHIFFGPKRSTSRPIGHAARKAAAPAQVRPRPTWAALSPTIWVKNTADPVMKVPSPSAKSSDWTASRPARGEGGRIRRTIVASIAVKSSSRLRQPSPQFPAARGSARRRSAGGAELPPPDGARLDAAVDEQRLGVRREASRAADVGELRPLQERRELGRRRGTGGPVVGALPGVG